MLEYWAIPRLDSSRQMRFAMSRICNNIGNKHVPRLKQPTKKNPLGEKKIREPENHKSFIDVASACPCRIVPSNDV
jgi:hypothetical protein